MAVDWDNCPTPPPPPKLAVMLAVVLAVEGLVAVDVDICLYLHCPNSFYCQNGIHVCTTLNLDTREVSIALLQLSKYN